MPRKPRFFVPEFSNHIVQRGNNKTPIFFEDADYLQYKKILIDAAIKHDVKIHAYVLMSNHIHLLATSSTKQGISSMMQQIGRFYVPYINHKYKRTGTLWEGRFKSSLVDNDFYVLACMRYIELNPVRANMVKAPQDYQWSSYLANALGHYDAVLTQHASYQGLSDNTQKRRETYINLFLEHLDKTVLMDIRACMQTGTPLGNDTFREKIESKLKIKVGYSVRGRPKKPEC